MNKEINIINAKNKDYTLVDSQSRKNIELIADKVNEIIDKIDGVIPDNSTLILPTSPSTTNGAMWVE